MFVPCAEYGIILISPAYVHETQIAKFSAAYKTQESTRAFYAFSGRINDCDGSNVMRLSPGDRIHMSFFRAAEKLQTPSVSMRSFIESQPGYLYVGAQGLSYLWTHIRGQLPIGSRVASFEKRPETDRHESAKRGTPCIITGKNHRSFECIDPVGLCLECDMFLLAVKV